MSRLEICCCREPSSPASCRNVSKIAPYEQYLTSVPNHQTSSYCGLRPILQEATPSDMVIVCSEYSLQIQPETSSVEEEVVLFP